MILKEFIEVTSIYDGRKGSIRAACIDAVIDNAAETDTFATGACVSKPACRTIRYGGCSFDAVEGYADICDMIYKAEL